MIYRDKNIEILYEIKCLLLLLVSLFKMANPHWFFVINPVSGNKKGLTVWSSVKEKLEIAGIDFSFAISEFHKHTIQLVHEKHASGCRHFIGIGGDGTLNEMVNGLMVSNKAQEYKSTIGLIPVGTGNDWVKSQAELFTVDSIVSKLRQNQTRIQNIGKVALGDGHSQYFLNIAGAGIDGAIVNELEAQNTKGRAGQWVYIKSLIKTLFTYKTPVVQIDLDSDSFYFGEAFIVAASLGKFFGSGMLLSPNAKMASDTLEFTLAKKDKLFRVFPQLHKLFNGRIEMAGDFEDLNSGDKVDPGSPPTAIT